jgi:MurNAc alpha-1-phosphate uridylyltransferase
MKALIFAAGRGERMRPLTDTLPKPLLVAGGRRLIEWQLTALARAGVAEVVINTAHRPEAFPAALGDGRAYGLRITYSQEGSSAVEALETLGGIVRALPLLGSDPFIAVSGDIVTDYDYARLRAVADRIALGTVDAHLVLVDNPPYHPQGDMGLRDGRIVLAAPHLTYANIGVFAPRLFAAEAPGRRKLFPWLYPHAAAGRVSGEHHRGRWANIGTPDDLARLDRAAHAAATALS